MNTLSVLIKACSYLTLIYCFYWLGKNSLDINVNDKWIAGIIVQSYVTQAFISGYFLVKIYEATLGVSFLSILSKKETSHKHIVLLVSTILLSWILVKLLFNNPGEIGVAFGGYFFGILLGSVFYLIWYMIVHLNKVRYKIDK